MVSPAWLGQVDGVVERPVLGDHLCTNSQRSSPRDALNCHVPGFCDDRTVRSKGKLGSFLAKVSLASNGSILLVEFLLDDILFSLKQDFR